MHPEWFSFKVGEWMESSSDEEVLELEWPTMKLKLSFLHAQTAGTLYTKIKKASIVRQQNHRVLLWVMNKLLFSVLFWHICLAECPFLIFAY